MTHYDKIILIASRSYTSKDIKRYNELDHSNACIVAFNKITRSRAKLFKGKYHIRFLRGFPPHVLKDYRIIGRVNKKATYYIYRNHCIIKKTNNLKNVIKINERKLGIPRVDNKKCNSLGFTAYSLLSQRYPDIPIYLIGFTFLSNNRCHNGDKEKDIILSDPRVILIK